MCVCVCVRVKQIKCDKYRTTYWLMRKFHQKFSYLFEIDSFGDSSHDYTGLPSELGSFSLRSLSLRISLTMCVTFLIYYYILV